MTIFYNYNICNSQCGPTIVVFPRVYIYQSIQCLYIARHFPFLGIIEWHPIKMENRKESSYAINIHESEHTCRLGKLP